MKLHIDNNHLVNIPEGYRVLARDEITLFNDLIYSYVKHGFKIIDIAGMKAVNYTCVIRKNKS